MKLLPKLGQKLTLLRTSCDGHDMPSVPVRVTGLLAMQFTTEEDPQPDSVRVRVYYRFYDGYKITWLLR